MHSSAVLVLAVVAAAGPAFARPAVGPSARRRAAEAFSIAQPMMPAPTPIVAAAASGAPVVPPVVPTPQAYPVAPAAVPSAVPSGVPAAVPASPAPASAPAAAAPPTVPGKSAPSGLEELIDDIESLFRYV